MGETAGQPAWAAARSRQELEAALQQDPDAQPQFLCFWGHRATADGSVGPSCLSQWWPAPFVVDGVTYLTAEHWMMAGKARLFGDETALSAILEATEPKEVKQLGRGVQGFDEAAWNAARWDLVVEGNVAKFGQDPALQRFLLSTAPAVLVEASPVDRVWGIGLGADDKKAQQPAHWRGLNLLGFALMEARQRLQRASEAGSS